MDWNPERVRQNARQAPTEDLLDRVTVYRAGMEPEAVAIIEAELRRRGVDQDAIDNHLAERDAGLVKDADGTARQCSFCPRPAVWQARGWHRLWGIVPLLPRTFFYCENHREGGEST